jgi:very-short-patch-repair endonuclease
MARGAEVDRVIQGLGARNNRVVTRRAAHAAGIPDNALTYRVATGRLYREHYGVYLLDPPANASRVTLMTAAVAACGPTAVLSHRSAAELWGMVGPHLGHLEVTIVEHNAGDRPGIRRHRVSEIDSVDIRTRRGIPVTSPARTVLDNARAPDFEELIATAIDKGLATARQIEHAIERCSSRRGVRRLRRILHQPGGPRRTRSWAERRLLALVRQAGLPVPMTNRLLNGYQVDAVWPDHRLVVEIDGYEFHGGRRAFETDRKRDAAHVAAGYRVIRFTADQLEHEPLLVIGQLSAALALALAS